MMTLKEMRAKTYLSQAKFAKIVNIPVANITKWEQGVSTPPDYVVRLVQSYLLQLGLLTDEEVRDS